MVAIIWIWLMKQFVMQLLKAYFYITESNHKKNQLFYFRKKNWQKLNDFAYQKLLKKGNLRKLTRRQAVEMAKVNINPNSNTDIKPALLRFIPKCNDLRPILPVRKGGLNPIELLKAKLLVNHMANVVFKGLPSVRSFSNYQIAWLEYNQTLDKDSFSPTYVVKVDIKDAFGSIKHDVLVNLLLEAENMTGNLVAFGRYSALNSFGKAANTRVTYIQVDSNGHRIESGSKTHKALVKDGHPLQINTRETIKIILRLIAGQVIRAGAHRRLWMVRGIAQGASLSSALCELYYAAMCKKYLMHFQGKQRAILRSVDDFLYITPCMEQAKEFLKFMETGIEEFNCSINPSKTMHNIDGNNTRILFRGTVYCTLSKQILVAPDLLASCPPRYSLSLNKFQRPGKFIILRLNQITKAQLSSLLFHPSYVSTHALIANIWRAAITVGGRLISLIKTLLLPTQKINAEFICRSIIEVSGKIWARVKGLWGRLQYTLPFNKSFLQAVFLGGIFNVMGLPRHPPLQSLRICLERKIRKYVKSLPTEQIYLLPRAPKLIFNTA